MIAQIGPLVEVGRRRTMLTLHLGGGLLGGAVAGLVLGFAGVLLAVATGGLSVRAAPAVVCGLLVVTALSELRLLPLPYVTSERQTPGFWPCALGSYPASFAWGFDLGLGVTTRLPYQPLLALPVFAVLAGDVALGVAAMAAYGGARAAATVAAIATAGGDYAARCDTITRHEPRMRVAAAATAALLGGLLLATAL